MDFALTVEALNLYSLNVLFTIMPAAGRRVSSVNHLTVSDQNVLIYYFVPFIVSNRYLLF